MKITFEIDIEENTLKGTIEGEDTTITSKKICTLVGMLERLKLHYLNKLSKPEQTDDTERKGN